MHVLNIVLGLLLALVAVLLILLVLVQRGRGGGLSGALGGMGGQSAFGAKAGDMFTRITIGTATVWIVLCVLAVKFLGTQERIDPSRVEGSASASAPVDQPADGGSPPVSDQDRTTEAERSTTE
jgi:preprotein translocase subunit SecG